jgi:hypothetical protein
MFHSYRRQKKKKASQKRRKQITITVCFLRIVKVKPEEINARELEESAKLIDCE